MPAAFWLGVLAAVALLDAALYAVPPGGDTLSERLTEWTHKRPLNAIMFLATLTWFAVHVLLRVGFVPLVILWMIPVLHDARLALWPDLRVEIETLEVPGEHGAAARLTGSYRYLINGRLVPVATFDRAMGPPLDRYDNKLKG